MKWGLVLSGGSALGMANAGVLERLEEENLKPDFLAGSSMGAIIGSLYALGHPPSVFRDLLKELKVTKIAKLSDSPLKKGLHGGLLRQRITDYLEPFVGNATLADCTIPFVCVAGRVIKPIKWETLPKKGFLAHITKCVDKYTFPPETRILDAILASSSLPVIFSPVNIGNNTFVDLCTFGAIPARTLREIHNPDIIIGTDTTPRYPLLRRFSPASVREFIKASQVSRDESREECDLVIEPKLPANMMRFDKGEEFIESGKEATDEIMPTLKKLIN
ncbi:MAG: patatin-like phospholipase family protein [Kiritimatiellales bacterium]|nr:patatin-like phospholipase family protein [Kiritimatiellales bacterium]